MEPTPTNQEQPQNGLPIISQETRDALLQELGLTSTEEATPSLNQHPTDEIMRDYINMQTGKTIRSQVEKSHMAERFALEVLDDIADSNPHLLKMIRESVISGLEIGGEGWSEMGRNDMLVPYARGLGVIIRAFHMQSDFKLISDLSKLTPEDLSETGTLIENKLKSLGGLRPDPFTKAINRPRIPATQAFLQEIVDGPTKLNNGMFDADYKTGAAVMYEAIGNLWHKLYPGQNSDTPSSLDTPSTEPQKPVSPPPTSPGSI